MGVWYRGYYAGLSLRKLGFDSPYARYEFMERRQIKMNSSQIGNIGEVRVLSEFIKLGIPCYIPYGDGNICDLIADFNGKLNKIQIKTCQSLNKSGAMEWKVTRQEGYHGSRMQYDYNDIDYFGLYCIETDEVCLFPYDENCPKTTISIRLDNYSGVRTNTMRFASDFRIQNFINL